MGREREERLLKSLSTARLPLALLHSSSKSSFHSCTLFRLVSCSFAPSVPLPLLPPRSSSLFLSLISTVFGHNGIRAVIVPRSISGRAPRLLEMMQLNDNRVSQRWAQSHPSNLQLNSAQFTLRHLLGDAHIYTHTDRQTKQ